MRPIAIVGWLSILGALLARQGLGLVRGPEWPTLSDFFEGEFASAFPDCEAGAHNVTMSVAYADFQRLARPTVADIAMTG